MSNTIGYRIEYQEYQQIHHSNLLAQRFPIGKVAQISSFTAEDLRRFYKKWYRPDNMSLYLVGMYRGALNITKTKTTQHKATSMLRRP